MSLRSSAVTEKRKQLESKELGLENFEDAIKTILTEIGESDLDKLVRNFIQMKEQNYILLNVVNCQNNETMAIQREISQLCNEMESSVAEKQQRRQQEQHHTLQRVAIKQEAIEQQLAANQQRVESMEKLLDQLKGGIESLLQIIYGSSVIYDRFGSSNRVQDNIEWYMGMVEAGVNELLTLQSCLRQPSYNLRLRDIDSPNTIAGQLLGVPPPAVNLITAAATPASDDLESVLLEAKEPLSRKDLVILVNKSIQRRRTDRMFEAGAAPLELP